MRIDDSLSNITVIENTHFNNLFIQNLFRFSNVHTELKQLLDSSNSGYFLSEERDRRFIFKGFELYIPDDGQFATLFTVSDGQLDQHPVAHEVYDSSVHSSPFHQGTRPLFFTQLNTSDFYIVHITDTWGLQRIHLFYADPITHVLQCVPLFKKQVRNVVFAFSTLRHSK